MKSRVLVMLATAGLAMGSSSIAASTPVASAWKPSSQAEFAQKILDSKAADFLTWPAKAALESAATGNQMFRVYRNAPGAVPYKNRQPPTGNGPKQSTFKNVIVNYPQEDTNYNYSVNQLDQTTQSETSIAVHGNNLVTGFNDSYTTLLALTQGTNLNGFSYSTNGGQSWQDGGTIPNLNSWMNFGDPWIASDSTGNFYYSSLMLNLTPQRFFTLDVGVAKSTDGGKTFSPPTPVDTLGLTDPFYSADKDSLASGPAPASQNSNGTNLYDSWDDFTFDFSTLTAFSGLALSYSYDGGTTWTQTYVDKIPLFGEGCSFQQFIGANPFVDPSNGDVYDAVERLFVNNPDCNFNPEPPLQREEDLYRSADGGNTWGPRSVISNANPAQPNGLFFLGPNSYMRDLEFPTTAMAGGALYVAWNDGVQPAGAPSRIKIAKSTDHGQTWTSYYTNPGDPLDEIQPAMAGDASGLHILYYVRNADLTLDTYVQNSPTGDPGTFVPLRVSTMSFPGAYTFPQADPIIAFGYMGDYIGITTDGVHEYMTWGDNRDRVCNFLYPACRPDPNVYEAIQ